MPWGSAVLNEFCTSKLKTALNVYASILISSSSESRPVLHTDKAAPIWHIKPACSTKDNSTRSETISSRFPLQPTNKGESAVRRKLRTAPKHTRCFTCSTTSRNCCPNLICVCCIKALNKKCVIRSADAFESSQRGWAHTEPSTWGGLLTPPLQSRNE